MKNQNIHISTTDHRVLNLLLEGISGKDETLDRLRGELARAVVLDPAVLPPTVAGLHSHVELLDLDTNESESYVLTMPAEADPDRQRISVLSPVGTALLGYGEGDEVEWPTPGGLRRLKLLKVGREKEPAAPR